MIKFKQAYTEMVLKYQQQFEEFKHVHDEYQKNPNGDKSKFDELGRPIVRIIQDTENRLCGKMENSGRGRYADNLAEKFKAEVKKYLPLIDLVGVTVE